MREFKPGERSSTAWAFSSLRELHCPLMEATAASAIPKISDSPPLEYKPLALKITAWAVAVLDVRHLPLLHSIAAASLATITAFHPQALANTAWAFSKLHFAHPPLFHALAAAARAKITDSPSNDWTAQHLSITSWSVAQRKCVISPLWDALAAASIKIISDFIGQRLSNTAWSLAALYRLHPTQRAFGAVGARRALRLPVDFDLLCLSAFSWAVAQIQFLAATLSNAIASSSLRTITESYFRDIGGIVWAFSGLTF